MSSDESQTERRVTGLLFVYWAVPLVIGIIFALYLYVGRTPQTSQGPKGGPARANPLEAARASLARATDLATCRSALQQINAHLARNPNDRPPSLTAEQAAGLEKRFGLDKGERAEVAENGFTTLDAAYLDRCFLMRDVVRSLDVRGVRTRAGKPVRPTPVDQASTAFAWVVREVRLQERPGAHVPPAFIARRGWGTSLERALIFLALLEQMGHETDAGAGLTGCLLFCPGKDGATRLWACGVLVADRPDVYLFDPRLGLPLPGPEGKGVATLAEVCGDPAVLKQLDQGDKHRYDVTPEQARKAELSLVCSLSALAPRMRALQDRLLLPAVRVRLAHDPDRELAALKAAAAVPGVKGVTVGVWKEGTGLLRGFLPPAEGGADKPFPFAMRNLSGYTSAEDRAPVVAMTKRLLFNLDLAPWGFFPAPIRENPTLYSDLLPGQHVRQIFLEPFTSAAMNPGKSRDLLLRGRFDKAAPELSAELSSSQDHQKLPIPAEGLQEAVLQWSGKAQQAYAAQVRARGKPTETAEANARIAALWEDRQPVPALLRTAVARARVVDLTYQLGLCMHEQAERRQARLDLAARAGGVPPSAAERQGARDAWEDARSWWKRYGEEYGKRVPAAAARRLRGRAEAMLGNRDAAVAAWQDLFGVMTPLEQVAVLYLARQLKTK